MFHALSAAVLNVCTCSAGVREEGAATDKLQHSRAAAFLVDTSRVRAMASVVTIAYMVAFKMSKKQQARRVAA